MTDRTASFSLPYILASQAQKHLTHNEALMALDAIVQLSVRSDGLGEPPSEPTEGERYLVPANATGAFAGRGGMLAVFGDGTFRFYSPSAGWRCWVEERGVLLVFDGENWIGGGVDGAALAAALSGGTISKLGIGTSADDYNRMALKASAFLASHDDVSGTGNGSILGSFNKQAPGKDAGFNLQTGYSTRALLGLFGSDDFTLKVSPDGGAFHDALVADRQTGFLTAPSGGFREQLRADRTYYVDAVTGLDSRDGLTPQSALATLGKAYEKALRLDANGRAVTLRLSAGTHTIGDFMFDKPLLGIGRLEILGDVAHPTNVVVANAGVNGFNLSNGFNLRLRGVRFRREGSLGTGAMISVGANSRLTYDQIVWGSVGTGHLEAPGGDIEAEQGGSCEIDGGGLRHISLTLGGTYSSTNFRFVLTGVPAFSAAFIVANAATCQHVAPTYSGSISGKDYLLSLNSNYDRGGGGPVPGSSAGTTANASVVLA